ncbi:MAG: serine/threonine protein kinase [Gemmatimonadaceae bacterium]|nr:serine/threonine protein kinase [Gemmatimonadaceae bacterium]
MTEPAQTIDYLGKFRLMRRVARGGMATVYEAEQIGNRGFTKRVALKVIHDNYAHEPEWLQLFIDEAKLSANLVHGNIVQIYQFQEVDGRFYMAMEFIRGVTVRALIDRHRALDEPVPPAIAAYIVSRVCRALDFAHNFVDDLGRRLYIVHRDVSPGNILLTWDGQVKLADFGIAKARTMHDPAEAKQMTIGKKHYMSPEQVLGLKVDWRTDIFSSAVVLFELLAREQLFREIETEAAMDEVTVAPTPNVTQLLPEVDAGLSGLIALAISKDPMLRPNAAMFGLALDQWCARRKTIGSPERLQEHLARLFPATYSPPVEVRHDSAT